MQRLLPILLVLFAIQSAVLAMGAVPVARPCGGRVVVLHTNDTHSHIDDGRVAFSQIAAEKAKLEKQEADLRKWIRSAEGKLSNPGFVSKAPPAVIEAAKKQLADLQEKLDRVLEALKRLS